MLKLLAIAALIATTSAEFVEYSENAVETYVLKDVKEIASPANAEAINSDREFEFILPIDDMPVGEEGMFLSPFKLPVSAQGDGHRICGNLLGINIINVGTFCNASYLHVGIEFLDELYGYERFGESDEDYVPEEEIEVTSKVEESKATDEFSDSADETEDKRIMHLMFFFESTLTKKCLLDIPIFKIPSQLDSSDLNKLETWAHENRVGLFSRDDVQKLSAVSPTQGLTTNFKWLHDVLKYGVMKYEDEDLVERIFTKSDKKPSYVKIPAFITRPIVLSGKDEQKLEKWMAATYLESLI